MAFRVGQKVVCVDDQYIDPLWELIPNRPVRGQVYTIRGFKRPGRNDDGRPRLLLNELSNPRRIWNGEYSEGSFTARRFRPTVEKKTDISIFTEMLKPKQRELVSQ